MNHSGNPSWAPDAAVPVLKQRLVGDLQRVFSQAFPNLKLEVYKQLELNGILVSKKMDTGYRLPEFRILPTDITASSTVAQLKEAFAPLAGHTLRVFRKAGSLWIETSLTDDWTLMRQNEEGKL